MLSCNEALPFYRYPVDEYEPVWLEEVSCSFNDQTIYQCNHQPAACSHSQDIALQCSRFSEEFPIPTTSWWPGPWWRTTDNPWEWQTATTASGKSNHDHSALTQFVSKNATSNTLSIDFGRGGGGWSRFAIFEETNM